jgi:dihydroxyacetone kinase
LSLDEVARVAQKTADSLATVAVSLDRCSVPQREDQEGLDPDTVEYGMGIHNEPGAEQAKLGSLEETVAKLLSILLPEHTHCAPEAAVMINNLGGLSVLELQIVADEILRQLASKLPKISRVFIGSFVTALDGPGVSVTLLNLDPELEALLDAPTSVLAWPKTAPGYSQAGIDGQIVSAPLKRAITAEGCAVPKLPRKRLQSAQPLLCETDMLAQFLGHCFRTLSRAWRKGSGGTSP